MSGKSFGSAIFAVAPVSDFTFRVWSGLVLAQRGLYECVSGMDGDGVANLFGDFRRVAGEMVLIISSAQESRSLSGRPGRHAIWR